MAMATFRPCKRCTWSYMQNVGSVRPPPWTDDDAGLMFQRCRDCGSISIQKFAPDGDVGSVWMLSPDAMVLFRQGVPPATVSNYVFSDDFARNRGATLRLFRGYLASMHDLSGFLNVLIAKIGEFDEVVRVELCLDMLLDVTGEFFRREGEARLGVATLAPLVELMRAQRPLRGQSAGSRFEVRSRSLEILETFAQPALWRSVPTEEMRAVEETLDHHNMIDESVARMTAMAREIDDAVLMDALVEARFLYRLFRRRQARLSRAHAAAVWQLMRRIAEERSIGSPLEFATKTYDALRKLLEHQLVESGFFKIGKIDRDSQNWLQFKSPNTQEVLAVPSYVPRLEIYETAAATEPAVALDSWTAALDRL